MMPTQQTYSYTPLPPSTIRLLTLHPGPANSDLLVSLTAVPLPSAPATPDANRLSTPALKNSLPEDFVLFQTPEGKYFFNRRYSDTISYIHPRAGEVTEEPYALPDPPGLGEGRKFEALSYVWGSLERSCEVFVRAQGDEACFESYEERVDHIDLIPGKDTASMPTSPDEEVGSSFSVRERLGRGKGNQSWRIRLQRLVPCFSLPQPHRSKAESSILSPTALSPAPSMTRPSPAPASHPNIKVPSLSPQLSTLPITPNLFQALYTLRHKTKLRTLWVDSLCINQTSPTERAEQVKLMASIYGLATRVVVYLGPTSTTSGIAIETLRWLGGSIEISRDRWKFPSPSCAAEDKDVFRRAKELPFSSEVWDALTEFFAREWFERLWTLQEILLANPAAVVLCGEEQIPYHLLRRAIVVLLNKAGANIPAQLAERVYRLAYPAYGIEALTLTRLLRLSASLGCSDPRDKVYGVLSLLGPKMREAVEVDYEVGVETVYREVMLEHCRITSRLDLLTEAGGSGGELKKANDGDLSLPSWVPDWRIERDGVGVLGEIYQAAGLSRAHVEFVPANVLNVHGVFHAEVAEIAEPYTGTSTTELLQYLQRLRPPASEAESDYQPTGNETLHNAWLRTLFFDNFEHRHLDSVRSAFPTLQNIRSALFDALENPEDIRNDFHNKIMQSAFGKSLEARVRHQRFFHSSRGHLGFAPVDAQVDDVIVVFLGCWAPMILRRQASGCFRVVGAAYVHGLMDGEALVGSLPKGWNCFQEIVGNSRMPRFVHMESGERRKDDLRLEELENRWRRVEAERELDDGLFVVSYRNELTGEVVNFDPRLGIDKMREKGVALEVFGLV